MKDKLILTEKQKELVEQFKNLLNKMRNENIGIIGETSFDSHYSRNEQYLYFYNASEVEDIINMDELEDDDYVTNKDAIKVQIPIDYEILDHGQFENDEKCVFIFKEE